MLFLISCSQIQQKVIPPVISADPPVFNDLSVEYTVCTGEGIITSRGMYSGQLRFRFTSGIDSTRIRFSDILGRQVLEIRMNGDSLTAQDLLKNQKYSTRQLVSRLPVLKLFTVRDLRDALWGIPPVPSTYDKIQTEVEIKLESEPTEYGVLLQRIIVKGKKETNMVIQFLSRKMGHDISEFI